MNAGCTSLSYCNEGHSGSLGSQLENPGEADSGVLLSLMFSLLLNLSCKMVNWEKAYE